MALSIAMAAGCLAACGSSENTQTPAEDTVLDSGTDTSASGSEAAEAGTAASEDSGSGADTSGTSENGGNYNVYTYIY